MRKRLSFAADWSKSTGGFHAFQAIKGRWELLGWLHLYRERKTDPSYLKGVLR